MARKQNEKNKIIESALLAAKSLHASEYQKSIVYHAFLIINGMPAPKPGINIAGMPAEPLKKGSLVSSNRGFYKSFQWRKVRFKALNHYSGECMLCGRSHKKHGVVITVDHIKPRSKFPELALDFDNLQLLCEDCNFGKADDESKDYR